MLKSELFDLIKSMTPSEKRLFKIKTANYTKNLKTNELFDIYAQASSVEMVDKQVAKKIKTKRASKLHSELYQSLHPFFAELEIKSDRRLQLYQKIFTARNFMRRGLHTAALKIAETVTKETLHFEMFEVTKEALALKQVLINQVNDKSSTQLLQKTLEEAEFVNQRLFNIHHKFVTYRRILNDYSINGPARNKKTVGHYLEILAQTDKQEKQGFRIGKMNILIASLACMMIQNKEKSLALKGELVQLYEQYHDIAALNPRDYSVTYMNYSRELINNAAFETAQQIISKGQKLIQEHPEIQQHQIYYLGWLLIIYIRQGNIGDALALAPQIAIIALDEKDDVYKNYISVKIVVAYLLANKYEEALDFINSILNIKIKTLRKDGYSILLIYEIIIYLKMDWDSIAEAKLMSLNRYLKSNYNKQAFEKWVLQLLRQIIRDGKDSFPKHTQTAFHQIHDLRADALSSSILQLAEFEVWLKHEIKNNRI